MSKRWTPVKCLGCGHTWKAGGYGSAATCPKCKIGSYQILEIPANQGFDVMLDMWQPPRKANVLRDLVELSQV